MLCLAPLLPLGLNFVVYAQVVHAPAVENGRSKAAAHILAWRSRLRSRGQTVRTANESARRDASAHAKHARQPSRARGLPPAKGTLAVLWAEHNDSLATLRRHHSRRGPRTPKHSHEANPARDRHVHVAAAVVAGWVPHLATEKTVELASRGLLATLTLPDDARHVFA